MPMDRKLRSLRPQLARRWTAILRHGKIRMDQTFHRLWFTVPVLCAGCAGVTASGQKPEGAGFELAWLQPGPGGQPGAQWPFILLLIGLGAGLAALIFIPRAIEKRGTDWKNFAALSLLPHRLRRELALLKVEAGEDPHRSRKVIPIRHAVTRIGRAADNDVVFAEEKAVSRNHAVIEYQGGSFRISEVMSIQEGRIIRPTYGTFVNGVPISGNLVYLQDGDEIRLGKHLTLRFQPLVRAQARRSETETRTVDHRTG